MGDILTIVLKRLGLGLVTLLVISVIIFFLSMLLLLYDSIEIDT